jgi:hypothetical protein
LSRAIVPPQNLAKGGAVVRIQVIEGYVDLPARAWPIAILTLTNRTLSPVVARFIECAREVANSMGERLGRASPHKTHISSAR